MAAVFIFEAGETTAVGKGLAATADAGAGAAGGASGAGGAGGAGAASSKRTTGPNERPVMFPRYVSYNPVPPLTVPAASSWYCRPPCQVMNELLAAAAPLVLRLNVGHSANGTTPAVVGPYLPQGTETGDDTLVPAAPCGKATLKSTEDERVYAVTDVVIGTGDDGGAGKLGGAGGTFLAPPPSPGGAG